jgi:ribose/xylose/arabinose/galactoside ABC-type transport system permease subunit
MVTKKEDSFLKSQPVVLLIFIIALAIAVSIANPNFIGRNNIFAVFQQISVLGIATMAATMLLRSALFDLSSAGIMSLTCVLAAKLITSGMYPVLAALVGIGASLAMGCLNGFIVSKTKTQPMIITLGMSYAYSGIALVLTGGVFIGLKGKFSYLGNGKIAGIPISIFVLIAVVIVTHFILKYTRYGRRLTAIGNSVEVAYLAGINVDNYQILNYTISGGVVGLAGLLLLSRLGSVVAGVGAGYELRSIAAAIIGGISLTGGKGSVFGAFLGCILMGILANGMNLLNFNVYYQNIVLGIVIVAAVIISNFDNIRRK